MSKINPYIGFNGKTREAMTFYKDIFGGELELQEVAGSPMEQMWPSGAKDAIFHSALTGDGILIMGSDMSGSGGHVQGNDISLAISCSSEEEINTYFNKLAEGGHIMDPLKEQFWGAIFGAVKDKFGIKWMLNYNK
ncbi:MAG: VOC family protein [Bacteroidota bacterium]